MTVYGHRPPYSFPGLLIRIARSMLVKQTRLEIYSARHIYLTILHCAFQYILLIVLVLTLEAVVLLLVGIFREDAANDLEVNLPRVFLEEYSVNRERTLAIDEIQQTVRLTPSPIARFF